MWGVTYRQYNTVHDMFIVEPHSVWVALFLAIAEGIFAIFSTYLNISRVCVADYFIEIRNKIKKLHKNILVIVRELGFLYNFFISLPRNIDRYFTS